jgi:hypothetical protein
VPDPFPAIRAGPAGLIGRIAKFRAEEAVERLKAKAASKKR